MVVCWYAPVGRGFTSVGAIAPGNRLISISCAEHHAPRKIATQFYNFPKGNSLEHRWNIDYWKHFDCLTAM
jgi:hypothetical protein